MKKITLSAFYIFAFFSFLAFSEDSRITGVLRKAKSGFYIVQKEERQSRTTYEIQKKNSDKKAWKVLKSLDGKVVTVDCRITDSLSPFFHKIEIISVEEYAPCQPTIQNH